MTLGATFPSDDSFLLHKHTTVQGRFATMRPIHPRHHRHLSRRETPEPPSDDEMAHLPSAKRLKYARKCTTNGASPANQLVRYDFGNTFEVLVGAKPDQQSFTVHHDIATQRSGFFRAARSNRWTDPTKPTELVDDEPSSSMRTCIVYTSTRKRSWEKRPKRTSPMSTTKSTTTTAAKSMSR